MNIAYVLYCSNNGGYLTSGAVHTTSFTQNPLFAHIYHSDDAANKTGRQLTKTASDNDRRPSCQKPYKLVVRSITNPTLANVSTVEATKVVSGYAIRIKIPKSQYTAAWDDFFKDLPWSVKESKTFVGAAHGIHSVLARGSKPKIWKTPEGAEGVLAILKTDTNHKYTMEVVPHSH